MICNPERFNIFIEDIADGYYETDLKGKFTFFNKALCRIFGYTEEELQGHRFLEFMDQENAQKAFENVSRVVQTGNAVTDIVWMIIRKDGQKRILEVSAKLITDPDRQPIGFRGIVRDITRMVETQQTREILFRIAHALPRYRELDDLLMFITAEAQELVHAESASVILLNEEKKEFFFRTVKHDDPETGSRMKEIRFPAEKGIAGYVYRTGEPLIVQDTSESIYFYKKVDEKSGNETRNMLDVPIRTNDRMIGVLCAVNKKNGAFGRSDIELLSAIASTVAPTIENARITEELKKSYEAVQSLNRAKEKLIHHLSHELKTPTSVLSASLGVLSRKLGNTTDDHLNRILERAQRNLKRILDIQYHTDDILRERDFQTFHMMSSLLDVCTDDLEALVLEYTNQPDIVTKIRNKINELFGPKTWTSERIDIDRFVESRLRTMIPLFSHRKCRLVPRIFSESHIMMPPEILSLIIDGLIRNAIENTPDGGIVSVTVRRTGEGPELEISDFGVGLTEENQKIAFESIFTARDTLQYSSKKPFDFNAGGKGFDLFKMNIYAQRYQFKIKMISTRCKYIPRDEDICPGDIKNCGFCTSEQDCAVSGGTVMTVGFEYC